MIKELIELILNYNPTAFLLVDKYFHNKACISLSTYSFNEIVKTDNSLAISIVGKKLIDKSEFLVVNRETLKGVRNSLEILYKFEPYLRTSLNDKLAGVDMISVIIDNDIGKIVYIANSNNIEDIVGYSDCTDNYAIMEYCLKYIPETKNYPLITTNIDVFRLLVKHNYDFSDVEDYSSLYTEEDNPDRHKVILEALLQWRMGDKV